MVPPYESVEEDNVHGPSSTPSVHRLSPSIPLRPTTRPSTMTLFCFDAWWAHTMRRREPSMLMPIAAQWRAPQVTPLCYMHVALFHLIRPASAFLMLEATYITPAVSATFVSPPIVCHLSPRRCPPTLHRHHVVSLFVRTIRQPSRVSSSAIAQLLNNWVP